jgi:hypothetical protein
MMPRAPAPVCKAFLVSRKVDTDPRTRETFIVGLCSSFQHHHFPAGMSVGIFGRLTSAHGHYHIEVQLQTPEGEVVWKDGPPVPWPMPDPLHTYDVKLNVCVAFPQPGTYDLVLLANGEELARHRFLARLSTQVASKNA